MSFPKISRVKQVVGGMGMGHLATCCENMRLLLRR